MNPSLSLSNGMAKDALKDDSDVFKCIVETGGFEFCFYCCAVFNRDDELEGGFSTDDKSIVSHELMKCQIRARFNSHRDLCVFTWLEDHLVDPDEMIARVDEIRDLAHCNY